MENKQFFPIRELSSEVARKIAAGEVIDRPAAVIRELIDNSIDAGASKIIIEISGGGINSIRISDNGSGMTKKDLEICTHTHTTSKIQNEDDLLSLSTLGFRGEALSSVNAVSRLEITTTRNGIDAWKLQQGKIINANLAAGTSILVEGLFENFPARKQFLKASSTETKLCKQIVIEKALAWPKIEFRFITDGKTRLILPSSQTFRDRMIAALEPKEPENFFYEIAGIESDFSFSVVIGSPDVVRSDRRQEMIFINGRRIQEYGLVQAIEYGSEGHFPNGGHPCASLFVTINPALVDFNIHPAKKEARFRDPGPLHHAVSSTIRNFFMRYTIQSLHREGFLAEESEKQPSGFPEFIFDSRQSKSDHFYNEQAKHTLPESTLHFQPQVLQPHKQWQSPIQEQKSTQEHADFHYFGQVLGTFLAVEKRGYFYLIDQHAAHERILYNELMSKSNERQELLIPYRIETSNKTENRRLVDTTEALKKAGFILQNEGDGIWHITAVPVRWKGTRKDLCEELLDPTVEAESLVSHLYATSACRAACKDGDILDSTTANSIIERAFALPEPVCPHGRPLWIIMDRTELFSRIRRT